jgi:hypothetical protein
MSSDDSAVVAHGGGGMSFVGPDGVGLFRAIAIKGGLRLFARTGMRPNRMWSLTSMLGAAEGITQPRKPPKRGSEEPGPRRSYPRSRKGAAEAAEDVERWISAMRSAIPVVGGTEGAPQ